MKIAYTTDNTVTHNRSGLEAYYQGNVKIYVYNVISICYDDFLLS